MHSAILVKPKTVFPDSDGIPMADNTLQFRWIVTIQGGLDALFANDPNVFIAGDLLWYPNSEDPEISQAPDVLVAFGRPKGYRGSYKQWEESDVAPQVVWEVMSPGNRPGQMIRKFQFYESYGVEEYYLYDPDNGELVGWIREGDRLKEIQQMQGWTSPRLKVHMEVVDGELVLTGSDGRKFASYVELAEQRNLAEKGKLEAETKLAKLREQVRALGANPEV